MKTFNVSGEVTVSCHTEIEAETKEDALRIAEERAEECISGMSHNPFCYDVTESFHMSNDGMPQRLEAVEE